MTDPTPPFAEKAQTRLDQIVRTAHRVRPADVGVWKSATGLPLSPADAVVIAPADLMWLVVELHDARLRRCAMSEFFIDEDGAFSGSTALLVTMPEGGFMRVVEKCELLDETWEAVVAAVVTPPAGEGQ